MGRPRKPVDSTENPTEEQGQVNVAELLARLAELEAKLENNKTPDTLLEMNSKLVNALAAERLVKEVEEADVLVENTCGASVYFEVMEPNGVMRRVALPQRSDKVYITRTQAIEISQKYPDFFAHGYVSMPSVVLDTPNVIRDIDAFLNGLNVHEVDDEIGRIDSIATLYSLFHHIENKRFGQVKMTPLGPELEELELPVAYEAAERAIQRRLATLANVNASAEGK